MEPFSSSEAKAQKELETELACSEHMCAAASTVQVHSACKAVAYQWPSVAADGGRAGAEPEPETGWLGREGVSGLDGSLRYRQTYGTLAFSVVLLATLSSRRVQNSRVH